MRPPSKGRTTVTHNSMSHLLALQPPLSALAPLPPVGKLSFTTYETLCDQFPYRAGGSPVSHGMYVPSTHIDTIVIPSLETLGPPLGSRHGSRVPEE